MPTFRILTGLLLLALLACQGETRAPELTAGTPPDSVAELAPSEPFDRAQVVLDPPPGSPAGQQVTVPVYVAAADDARMRGLMHREHFPSRAGMLFLFPGEHRGGFWMKNTLIPLSIAFFDERGRVLAVLDMEPCTAEPCPVHDPGVTYSGALEVNAGFFDEIGLDTTWRVELPPHLAEPE